MLKKFTLVAALVSGFGLAANAQITSGTFAMTHDTVTEYTTGTTLPASNGSSSSYVECKNSMTNTGVDTLTFGWKILFPLEIPTGWSLVGFCDNINCRDVNGQWDQGVEEISGKMGPGQAGALWLHLSAPSTTADGTGIVKVQIRTLDQTDTAIFVVIKGATGLSMINMDDTRIAVYPNPASSYVNVYTERSLKAAQVSIINVLGRELMAQNIAANSDNTKLDLNALATGTYMLRVTDVDGKVISSRKLTKQ